MEEINNRQTEMNNTITEIKNSLEGTNRRITEAEKWISELEDRMTEIAAREQNKGKRLKRTDYSLRDLWDNIKCSNIGVIGAPGKEKKGTEKVFEETIVENFCNMGKEIVNQVQEAQRVPYKINPRRNTLRNILIKLSKIKHKDVKSSKGKTISNMQGKTHMISSGSLTETLQARRQ